MQELPIACPACGHEQFLCFGLVGYRQSYDGARQNPPADRWAAMEPDWDIDYPVSVECQNCGTDVTRLFVNTGILDGILDSLFTNPKPKPRRETR